MLRTRGKGMRKEWLRAVCVALPAIAAATLWIAQPGVAVADTFTTTNTLTIDTAAPPGKSAKKFEITYSPGLDMLTAKVNGKDLGPGTLFPYPVKVNSSNYILKLDERGPFLITGGDSCVCVPRATGLVCYGNPCP